MLIHRLIHVAIIILVAIQALILLLTSGTNVIFLASAKLVSSHKIGSA